MPQTIRFALLLVALTFPGLALAQREAEYLPASQVEELDREGEYINSQSPLGKPPVDCADVLERVPRSQRVWLEKNADRYLIMPSGDAVDAFRGLAIREFEDRMRTVSPSARDRLQREYDELAPQGQIAVRFSDGSISYSPRDTDNAEEGDVIFEYAALPPLSELPIRPLPETTAAYILLGSRLDSPEHLTFDIVQQTDHWIIGYVEQDGRRISQRLAVHRRGARFNGGELERSSVLWPLSRTAESRREYWDRAPLPLYVSIDADDLRARPDELACAVERGRATLRTHTATTDRTRTVRYTTEPTEITGVVNRKRHNGPWVQKISWRSTPVSIRILSPEEYLSRLEQQDAPTTDPDEAHQPEVTHVLRLTDGRTLRGRLTSEPDADPITFVIVVGGIEQPMAFDQKQVQSLTQALELDASPEPRVR